MEMYSTERRYEVALQMAVERALAEDRVEEDVTTLAAVPEGSRSRARILFRREGVLAGTDAVEATFLTVDPDLRIIWEAGEGEKVSADTVVARITGATRSILRGERAALNFLMHLSGVATAVALYVAAVRGKDVEILDTRKTTPGLRLLEKRAVVAGGGVNHRVDLAEMALLKENHVAAAGGITEAVRLVRKRSPKVPIEVEVENETELEEAIGLGVERVMLDNFTDEAIRKAVGRIRRCDNPPYIEVSGGYDLHRVATAASLGMDGISVGAVTHSATAMDVSLLLEEWES